MFFGIVISLVYSKSFKNVLFKNSGQTLNAKTLGSTTYYYDDAIIIEPYKAKFQLYESPIGSVPVKFILGKPTLLKNATIPKFELLLSGLDGIHFQNYNKWNQNVNHYHSYFID